MIDINIYNIIGISILSNYIAHEFEPIQPAKQWLIKRLSFFNFFSQTLDSVFNCSRCLAFWASLFLFQNLPIAAICGFTALLYNYIYDRINFWYNG